MRRLIETLALAAALALPSQPFFAAEANASAKSLPLPFSLPAQAKPGASGKKVFAHYFAPFPLSKDNMPPASDSYERNFLSPDGEKGKHLLYGGYLRERPLPREPLACEDWALRDMMKEVRMASDIGLDGFCFDILGIEDGRCPKLELLLEAAAKENPAFKVMLMPDMIALRRSPEFPDCVFALIERLRENPALFRTGDGRLVVAPYCPAKGTAKWWAESFAKAKEGRRGAFFVPLFQGWWSYADEFAPVCDGFSDWGAGTSQEEEGDLRRLSPQRCRVLGKTWMAPVRPQDFRPKDYRAWEPGNSSHFRAMWRTAIEGGADWVQTITWNDYSESTEIAPSTGIQHSFYDLSAYFIAWFKTGAPPEIERDGILYFYRSQLLGLAPERPQGRLFKMTGEAPERIELLAFMKEPGTLEIEIGEKVWREDFPAGMNSFKAPASLGKPLFRLLRNGRTVIEFEGKWEIVGKAPYQDFLYRGGSSLRELAR